MRIVFQNQDFVIVRKDWGEHVHQPENHDYWVPHNLVLVTQLKKLLGQNVFPTGRLDAPTRGLLIFALSSESAGRLNAIPKEKKYYTLVRGWTPESGRIEIELENDTTGEFVPACTDYLRVAKFELPFAVGKKYSSSRYSLLRVELKSGRYHQIRRHFNRISHPVIGDREHGDSFHNRFFRERMQIPHLCLWAYSIEFQWAGKNFFFEDERDETWKKIFELTHIS